MTTTAIRQKLYEYIRLAKDRQIKAIYTMLEEQIEGTHDNRDDENFATEINHRAASLESGTEKGISWEAVKNSTRRPQKSAKAK